MSHTDTVLITGCSSGIGLAAAVKFAGEGYDVVATMRDLDRSSALRSALTEAGAGADVRVLDVADDRSVTTGLAGVLADHERVDVVISNAGIGIDGTTEELSIDDFRASFETNVLGAVRLLHAVMPAWRAQGGGRFVAVSSVAGAIGQPFNDAYCMSKFALEGLLESLAPVAAQFGVRVSMIEPGPVSGVFVDKSRSPQQQSSDSPYAAQRGRFQAVQDGAFDAAQTNEEIAQFLWDVSTSDDPKLRYQTSEMVEKMVGLKFKDMTGDRVLGMTSRWV
jgi:NAD(P)-dependent dehydrogenase (short-subunit alcohol dehydrogenase family)